MSRIITNNQPAPLSDSEVARFRIQHIPYRLRLIQLGRVVAPAADLIDSAMVEAGLIIGRQLLQFLGLGISHTPHLHLITDTGYHEYKRGTERYTDEVKVTDIRGCFVELPSLEESKRQILAEFYNAASKATAHLTVESAHNLSPSIYDHGCAIILELIRRHLPPDQGEQIADGNRP